MKQRLQVGIVGSGPVTQALHIPTLARLPDQFGIAHIAASSARTGPAVAGWVGARFSDNAEAVFTDPSVDVVLLNSPSHLHADHAIAAMEAGKRAILIEKPLSTSLDDAARVIALAEKTGTFLLVGAMHVFDPAWVEARKRHEDLIAGAQFVRSVAVLPPNPILEAWSGEVQNRPPYPTAADFSIPAVRAGVVSAVSINLGAHDLPLVRAALADWRAIEAVSAQPLPPFGYHQNLVCGDQRIQLLANLHTHRWAQWETSYHGPAGSLTVSFTPSYVPAGSGSIATRTKDGETYRQLSPINGYEAEWRHLHDVLTQGATPFQSLRDIHEDFQFAMRVAATGAIKAQEVLA